jgi:rhodanese-related sulfurtransferase
LNSEYEQGRSTEDSAIRVDRGDGQGLRQPTPPRAARPARPGSAHGRPIGEGEQAISGECPQHLQALHAAGLVTRERDGTRVRYELAGDDVLRLWLSLRDTSAERLAEVERSARDYLGEEVEGIDREELLKRLRRRDVIVVDVRPTHEFESGHIEGAQSIPLAELEQHLDELPSDREVIAYCRGPFCVMAHEAVHRLRAAGLPARRLEEGWPEWRLAELAEAGVE